MLNLSLPGWLTVVLLVVEYTVKVVAVGVVPENRRPSSSQAWLLLILFVPVLGVPLFLLIGSHHVQGRRHRIQAEANARLLERANKVAARAAVGTDVERLESVVTLNRNLGYLPCVRGEITDYYSDYDASIEAMTDAVRNARSEVHFEVYILGLDATTEPFLTAMGDAVRRGVKVRLLYDHLGSIGYPGYNALNKRLSAEGIEWHQMLPIRPLRGRWRRPDLRNHRKMLVIDGETAFIGSQNMIDASYLKRANIRAGRQWRDLNIRLTGEIVRELSTVFSLDWYTETGEFLDIAEGPHPEPGSTAMQLLPSGPGFTTEPNLRLFNTLVYRARRRLTLVSPYFVPDESLLMAVTTAAQRGVEVELFASAKADQFMVHHAQRSYYRALLEAGVRIHLYPEPAVLHTKFLTVDDEISLIGSSNMDMRSFYLDYEISLTVLGSQTVDRLQAIAQEYRDVSRELELNSWNARPMAGRYVDNVMRLTSALQ